MSVPSVRPSLVTGFGAALISARTLPHVIVDRNRLSELVANNGTDLCSGCTTILPAGMVAGCADRGAVVCLVGIDDGISNRSRKLRVSSEIPKKPVKCSTRPFRPCCTCPNET